MRGSFSLACKYKIRVEVTGNDKRTSLINWGFEMTFVKSFIIRILGIVALIEAIAEIREV
jgi:hypothetical protein